jgi:serine/threonine protein kinase
MTEQGSLAQIGKYPVVRKLGEGATSEVYLCTDPFNLRDVAIKVAFPESFHDPARGKVYRKLFLTEAKLAGTLQHPCICQIYDAVADERLHYIVMEYVDGGTIEKYCSPDALLSVEHTVEIIFKCTRAPANILHTGETDVKIADFGAALIASSMANVRLSGV